MLRQVPRVSCEILVPGFACLQHCLPPFTSLSSPLSVFLPVPQQLGGLMSRRAGQAHRVASLLWPTLRADVSKPSSCFGMRHSTVTSLPARRMHHSATASSTRPPAWRVDARPMSTFKRNSNPAMTGASTSISAHSVPSLPCRRSSSSPSQCASPPELPQQPFLPLQPASPARIAVLLVAAFPDPNGTAAGVRTLDLVRMLLALRFQVVLAHTSRRSRTHEAAFRAFESLGVRTAPVRVNDDGFDDWLTHLDATGSVDLPAASASSYASSSSFPPSTCPPRVSLVVFDRFALEEQFGWRVRRRVPHALRVLDTQDLHALRAARQRVVENHPFPTSPS